MIYSRCSNVITSSEKHILVHFKTFHVSQDVPTKCGVCQIGFANLSLLKQHIQLKHSNEYCKFRCDFCNFGAMSKVVIHQHKLEKHPEIPHFLCKACSINIFFTEADLELHMSTCSALLTCTKCFKMFKSRDKLNDHRMTCDIVPISGTQDHENENAKCFICNQDFKTDVQLGEHHATVHAGVKPYVCDGCGLSFSRKNNITKHKKSGACKGFKLEKLESGEFNCQKCGKTFKYKQSYTQHMEWVHLGHKKNQCEDCGQLFSQIHHLRRHRVKVHNHVMPHVCTVCDSRFVSMTQWKTHMKRYHEIDVTTSKEEMPQQVRTLTILSRGLCQKNQIHM